MEGCAIGISPVMLRLCTPLDVACATSPWRASDVLARTSRINSCASAGMGTSRSRMPRAAAIAYITAILSREPASESALAQPLQCRSHARRVASWKALMCSARRRA